MYLLGQKAVEQKEEDIVAAGYTSWSSCRNRFGGRHCCTSHGHRHSSLGRQKGKIVHGDSCCYYFIILNSLLVSNLVLNVFMSFQIHAKYEHSNKHKRNLLITGGVTASVLVSPILAGLAVGTFFLLNIYPHFIGYNTIIKRNKFLNLESASKINCTHGIFYCVNCGS